MKAGKLAERVLLPEYTVKTQRCWRTATVNSSR